MEGGRGAAFLNVGLRVRVGVEQPSGRVRQVEARIILGVDVEEGKGVGVREGVGETELRRQEMARMRWLLLSPMYRVPAEFTVTPKGPLKREASPPVEPPAIVVTTPRGVIMRIRLLFVSDTRRSPLVAKER